MSAVLLEALCEEEAKLIAADEALKLSDAQFVAAIERRVLAEFRLCAMTIEDVDVWLAYGADIAGVQPKMRRRRNGIS